MIGPTKYSSIHALLEGIRQAAKAGSLEDCDRLAWAAICVMCDLTIDDVDPLTVCKATKDRLTTKERS